MKHAMKKIILRLLFGKPLMMSTYKDKYGNLYGGVIHQQDGKSYITNTSYIDEPVYIGETEVYYYY